MESSENANLGLDENSKTLADITAAAMIHSHTEHVIT
jgi:hypothetical protein